MIDFPYTAERQLSEWKNFHGTINGVSIGTYCTLDAPSRLGSDAPNSFKRHGRALGAIIDHCIDKRQQLRMLGATWSFSDIGKPTDVAVDPAHLCQMLPVDEDCLTKSYLEGSYREGYRPMFVQSGATISQINSELAVDGLALQTSGASDGQCIGGCIATGTHGAAIGIGAVHDTVLGLHIIVGGDSSYFLHPKDSCFTFGDFATWLQGATGIKTEDKPDDNLFRAAQVSLGSLGVVHGVILEASPLYKLRQEVKLRDSTDPDLWDELRDFCTTSNLQSTSLPYHVEVIVNPHKRKRKNDTYLSLMWRTPAGEERPFPNRSRRPESSDTVALVGCLSDFLDDPISTGIFRRRLAKTIKRHFKVGERRPRFPGEVFGTSPLLAAKGEGISTELAVDASRAQDAYGAVRDVLTRGARDGQLLLGLIGLRFTKSTEAFLGLNAKEPTCFLDLPSIRNNEVFELYERVWDELDKRGVDFTCHWGKWGGFNRGRINRYFGPDRVAKWLAARQSLLETDVERQTFASPLIRQAGLIR